MEWLHIPFVASLPTVVQVFSLLAVATSYIGFVLGLTDFLADMMKARMLRELVLMRSPC